MKYGFIKVAAASINLEIANCEQNTNKIIAEIRAAANHGAEVLVLPELCITGGSCKDLFLQLPLILAAKKSIAAIAHACTGLNILVFVGAPIFAEGKLYNCAVAIYNGEILAAIPKTHLSIDEQRAFAPALPYEILAEIEGKPIKLYSKSLLAFGENHEAMLGVQLGEERNVVFTTAQHCVAAGANIIVNMVCSPEIAGTSDKRTFNLTSRSKDLVCGYIFCNAGQGESTTDTVYSGRQIIAENGVLLAQTSAFMRKNSCADFDIEKLNVLRRNLGFLNNNSNEYNIIKINMPQSSFTPEAQISRTPFIDTNFDEIAINNYYEEIFTIQAHGLAKRIAHIGAKCAFIGVSGGLDSTLALLVICKAFTLLKMPNDKICAVTMPCFGTSERTKANAIALCDLLKINLREIDIKNIVKSHLDDIGQSENEQNTTYENAQARMRTMLLFDLANKENGIVVGTGDLSEGALGWCTFGADHLSMYNVNCSVPKTIIRKMIATISAEFDENLKSVLADIVNTPISPELIAAPGEEFQSTEKILGPYDLHDFFLYYVIKYGFAPGKIFVLAQIAFKDLYASDLIAKTLGTFYARFFSQQFKRSCMPDGPQCTEISLSPRGSYIIPSDACAVLWKNEVDEIIKSVQ